MSDQLRDLVVKLSLDSNDFAKNIRNVNSLMKNTQSEFNLAAAGVQNFENSTKGMSMQLDTLKKNYSDLSQALRNYSGAMDIAQKRYENSVARQEQLTKDIEAQQNAIKGMTKGTDEYAAAMERLKTLREEQSSNKNTVSNNLNRWTTATTTYNNAQAAAKALQAQISQLEATLGRGGTALDQDNAAIERSRTALSSLGISLESIQSQYGLMASGNAQFSGSTAELEAKLQTLTATYSNLQNQVRAYQAIAMASENKMVLASADGDKNTIAQATDEWRKATTDLANAQAKLNNIGIEIDKTNAQLGNNASQWAQDTVSIQNANTAIDSLGIKMQQVNADFALYQAGIGMMSGSTAEMQRQFNSLTETLKLQQDAVKQYENIVTATKSQMDAATASGDKNRIRETTDAYNSAKVKLTEYQATAAKTAAEVDKLAAALGKGGSAWNQQQVAMDHAKTAVSSLGIQLETVQSKYAAFEAANAGHMNALEANKAKLESLRDQYNIQIQILDQYKVAVAAAAEQLKLAMDSGDPSKIQQATDAYNQSVTAMNNAAAAASNTKGQIDDLSFSFQSFSEACSEIGTTLYNNVTKPIVQAAEDCEQAYMTMETAGAKLRMVTAGTTEEQYISVTNAARDMSEELGVTASSVVDVMTEVGRLGVNITGDGQEFVDFTQTVENMALTLGVSAADAGTSAARFFNVMGTATNTGYQDITRYGSAVTYLANNYATTGSEIIEMAQGLSGYAASVKMSAADVLGVSTALSSVGITAAKGANAFGQALMKMETAVETDSSKLEEFAKVAGMTADEFKAAWNQDVTGTFTQWIIGLSQMDEKERESISVLQECGIKTARMTDSLLRIKNSTAQFASAIQDANAAWEQNTELETASGEVKKTLQVKVNSLKQKLTNLKETVGDDLSPAFETLLNAGEGVLNWLQNLSPGVRQAVELFAGLAAGVSAGILGMGLLGNAITAIGKGLSTFITGLKTAGTAIAGLISSVGAGPILIAALSAALIYGAVQLIDYASGAKAAREALEQLNQTAKEWNDTNVETSFEKSKGLSAFGLTDEDFGLDTLGSDWLTNLKTIWTDGKAETDEIVSNTVKDFTDGSDKIRESIQNLKDNNGGSTPMAGLDTDLDTLDQIDQQIQAILEKRQNGYLTDDDLSQLQSLIDQRDAIAVKYKLVLDDTDSAFDKISQGVEAALSRGADKSTAFSDAFSAATQGLGAYTDELNAEYDAQYAVIAAMDDSTEEAAEKKKQAFEELKEWYDQNARTAQKEYAEALISSAEQTGVFEDGGEYDDTVDKLTTIKQLMQEAAEESDPNGEKHLALTQALSELDETELTEMDASLSAIVEAADAAGVEVPENIQNAYDALKSVQDVAEAVNGTFDGDLGTKINEMFNGLTGEVHEVYVSLNCDNLSTTYDAWAQGEHAAIIPTISVDESTPVTGTVSVEGELITVTAPEGGSYTITDFQVGVGGVLEKVDSNGESYPVSGLRIKDGVLEMVKSDGSVYKVTDAEVDVDGTLSKVTTEEGKTYSLKNIEVEGHLKSVVVDESTAIPEVEVPGKVKYFEDDDYSPDKDPSTSYTAADNRTDKYGGFTYFSMDKTGEDIANLASDIELYNAAIESGDTDAANQYAQSIGSLGQVVGEDLANNDGKGFQTLAQYVANGLQLLANGDMTPEQLQEFAQTYQALMTILGSNYGNTTTAQNPLGQTLGEGLSGALTNYDWNVDDTNLDEAMTQAATQLQPLAEQLGLDYSAGVGSGAASYDFSGDMSTVATNATTQAGDAFGQGSPCEITKPLGNDTAAGIGVGMTQFDFSSDSDTVATNLMTALSTALSSGSDAVNSAAQAVVSGVSAAMSGAGSSTESVGRFMILGIARGINKSASTAYDAMRTVVQNLIQIAKDIPVIESPSHVMRDEVGAMLMKGMGVGITQEAKNTAKTMANATKYVIDSANGFVSGSTVNNTRNYNTSDNSINISVDGMSVRDDSDVRSLAIEIASLTRRNHQLKGVLT